MYRPWTIGCISGLLTFLLIEGSGCATPATQQADTRKGTTVEDLARGLRSAARNIEKEIPKIGPAIGKTVKSISGHGSETKRSPNLPADKK
jgi:hypothetical protein